MFKITRWRICRLAAAAMTLGPVSAVGVEAALASESIEIGPESRVCVSVEVDQRLWRRPLSRDDARNFSGSLMSELRGLYEQAGGSDNIGTNNEQRFLTNPEGRTPDCRDRDRNVHVDVRYVPRADGTPFVIDYSIRRGSRDRSGRLEVNLAEEISSGRIAGYTERRTDAVMIAEDIARRAALIFNHMSPP